MSNLLIKHKEKVKFSFPEKNHKKIKNRSLEMFLTVGVIEI